MNKPIIINLTGYSSKDDSISLLLYIENNSRLLREKYLRFISNLSKKNINNSNIVKLLSIDEETSLWWMSQLYEKSFYKSISISHFIKFIAIEEICKSIKVKKKLIFLNADKSYSYLIKELCTKNNYSYKIYYKKDNFKIFTKKIISNLIPSIFLSLLFFIRYLIVGIFINLKNNYNNTDNKSNITIFANLVHFDKNKLKNNELILDIFGDLSSHIRDKNAKIKWYYHFIKSKDTSSVFRAQNIINTLNKNLKYKKHNLIGHNIEVKFLFKVLFLYFKIYFRFFRLSNYKNIFYYKEKNYNCWRLFKNDWYTSTQGLNLIKNIFYIQIFEELFSSMPYQSLGIYVQENQGWERALINRWKKFNHGELIAYNHTFMRFWDTRYYDLGINEKNLLEINPPEPDKIAVNGPYCYGEYLKQNYKNNNLIKVEALRYSKYYQHISYKKNTKLKKNLNQVLILTSYKDSFNYSMLDCLSKYFNSSKKKYSVDIKMHPALNVKLSKINFSYNTIIEDDLLEIYKNYDFMIICGDSGAVLDLYLLGMPVLVYRDDKSLNYSPLKEINKKIFFSNSLELKKRINFLKFEDKTIKNQIFWFSKNNHRWKKLFSKHFSNLY